MQKKYGFVYIWYDKKHKRYYIGCHWGTENDGYICSSTWMKSAYKRRSQDFKRRILKSNILCKKLLLEEEYKWLSYIKIEELGKKYYNLNKHHYGHWFYSDNSLQIRENISKRMIGKRLHCSPHTEESRLKIKNSLKNSEKQKNKFTKEVREKMRKERLSRGEEYRKNMRASLLKVAKIHCIHCNRNIDPGNYKKNHGENCINKSIKYNINGVSIIITNKKIKVKCSENSVVIGI